MKALVASFLSLCTGILFRPERTLRQLVASPSWVKALAVTSGFALAYSAAALVAQFTGHRPVGQTVKFIPQNRYYFYESIFLLPITNLWMIMFAAGTRQIAGRFGGMGALRQDFTVLAFSQSLPMTLAFCLPDIAAYVLRLDARRYRRLVVIYGPAAVIWADTLAVLGIAMAERIPRRRSFAIVLAAQAASALASGVAILVR
jgi:hypothetical protein